MRTEIAVIGAGPAGLAAAIEAAELGAEVALIDENARPGGQLFKQIHKFFGSEAHYAGVRGYEIGQQLLEETARLGVAVHLDTVAWGLFSGKRIGLVKDERSFMLEADRIVVATGATEKAIAFPGWTLPGAMGAGAAQTMMNVHRVLPGKRALVVGAGNVGLIVAYQILQAGGDVLAVVEAADRIGGYEVHAAKLRRNGVPILTGQTVLCAEGNDRVERAVVSSASPTATSPPNSSFEVDLICLAVGLRPTTDLCAMAGCQLRFVPELGGHAPVHDSYLRTSLPHLYVAGDTAGVEEASTALEEGRLAGLAAAESLGRGRPADVERKITEARRRLAALRTGPFGEGRRRAKERLSA